MRELDPCDPYHQEQQELFFVTNPFFDENHFLNYTNDDPIFFKVSQSNHFCN
jgi:hypothetical protein